MDIQNFIANFAEQFDDIGGLISIFLLNIDDIDVAELHSDTIFHELDGWTSLAALSIIAMIDDEYNVSVSGKDIRESETIEDLYNVVKSKKG